MDLGLCTLESAPYWVSSMLLDDLLGVVHTLLVCLNHSEQSVSGASPPNITPKK